MKSYFIRVRVFYGNHQTITINIAHIVAYGKSNDPEFPGGVIGLSTGGDINVRDTPAQIENLINEAQAG